MDRCIEHKLCQGLLHTNVGLTVLLPDALAVLLLAARTYGQHVPHQLLRVKLPTLALTIGLRSLV